jgi:hypothetical protein
MENINKQSNSNNEILGKSFEQKLSEAEFFVNCQEFAGKIDELSIKDQQAKLNEIFNESRRESMINNASLDSTNRRVKYFRYMPKDLFKKILENKIITAEDCHEYHLENEDLKTSEKEDFNRDMKYLLKKYLEDELKEKSKFDGNITEYLGILNKNEKQLKKIPQDVIEQFSKEIKHSTIVNLVKDYFNQQFVIDMHTGSLWKKYSPFMSASVGGVIHNNIYESQVYVEMIIPDEEVVVSERTLQNKESFAGEKEVHLKNIKLDNISRVYVSENSLYNEQIVNNEKATPLTKYYNPNIGKYNPVDDWRWQENTLDYLPINILNKHQQSKL